MGKIEAIFEEFSDAGDCHRAQLHFDTAVAQVQKLMLETMLEAMTVAETVEEIGAIYIEKVNEL